MPPRFDNKHIHITAATSEIDWPTASCPGPRRFASKAISSCELASFAVLIALIFVGAPTAA